VTCKDNSETEACCEDCQSVGFIIVKKISNILSTMSAVTKFSFNKLIKLMLESDDTIKNACSRRRNCRCSKSIHCGRVSPNLVLGWPHRGPTSGTIQQFPNVFHNGFATLGYPECGPHWGHAQCGPRMWSILVCFHTTSPLCPILVFLPYRFPNVAHISVSYANLSRLFFVSPLNPLGLMHELS
jgi:hypothetical protein